MVDNNRSLIPVMILSCLEAAINTLIQSDRDMLGTFSEYAGKVVRVKTYSPELSLYFLFCTEGVQVLSQFDGHVDARIRAPASSLVTYLLSPDTEWVESRISDDICMSGNKELVATLNALANELNIWQLLRQLLISWMPNSLTLTEMLDALHRSDPVWIDKLQTLLVSMNSVKEQIGGQALLLQQQLDALSDMRRVMHLQQLRMQLLGAVGVMTMLLGLLGANGLLPVMAWVETIGALHVSLIVGGLILALLGCARLSQPRSNRYVNNSISDMWPERLSSVTHRSVEK